MDIAALPNHPGAIETRAGRPGLDLLSVLSALKRRWKVVAGTCASVVVLTFAVMLQIAPLYSGTTTVAIETRKTQVVDIAQVVEDPGASQAAMITQAEILRSPDLLRRVVETLRLDNDVEFVPDAGKTGSSTVSGPQLDARKDAATRALARHVTVTPLRNSLVLSLQATSTDPTKAAKIANALADAYIADQIESKYDATRRANAWLEKRVEELRKASVASDKAAEEYRIANGLVGGNSGGTVAGQQLSEVNSQVVMARVARAEKQAQLEQIKRLLASGNAIESSSAILQSGLIVSLRGQETEVLRKLSELQAVYGEAHPKIVNAKAELRDLREKIRVEIEKIAASTANDLAVARARERALSDGLATATGQSGQNKIAEVRYRELLTEAQSAKLLYETFLNRFKETSEQMGIQTADARVIAEAQVPSAPSYPNRPLVLAAGLALGVALGVILAVLLEWFDPYVRKVEELEQLSGKPLMALVPLLDAGEGSPEDRAVLMRTSATSEALASLRASLEMQVPAEERRVIMITSPIAGEGKTFLAVSLARTLAAGGLRVLLMDLDLRRPRVAPACGIDETQGFAEVVLGEAAVSDCIVRDPLGSMDILLAGTRLEAREGLLLSEGFARLMDTLRDQYDTIVVDTAPIAPISDSQLVARQVDSVLLAVGWGKAPVSVLRHSVGIMERLDLPFRGTVMTLVDLKTYASYNEFGHFYYYNRYGSYTYGA